MLRFGAQLYNLTERDQLGIYLEPFFRSATATLAITEVQNVATLKLPLDRAFFLHSISVTYNAEIATQWQQSRLNLVQAQNTFSPIWQETVNLAANTSRNTTFLMDLVLPPNSVSLQLRPLRNGTTGLATVDLFVSGYLMPPGEIARV